LQWLLSELNQVITLADLS